MGKSILRNTFADMLDKNFQEKDLPIVEQADQWLGIYFSGKTPDFTPPLVIKTTEEYNKLK